MTTKAQVDEFLNQKRVAIAGVSRTSADFSRLVFREFRARGYEVIPLNPKASEIEGQRCYARVSEVDPLPDAVLVMTSAKESSAVVQDAIQAGVKHVWLYSAVGAGAVSNAAVDLCEAEGVSVIDGQCPFMFFPNSGLIHRIHGAVKKLVGSYPK